MQVAAVGRRGHQTVPNSLVPRNARRLTLAVATEWTVGRWVASLVANISKIVYNRICGRLSESLQIRLLFL